MVLVDTSVLVNVIRDSTGANADRLLAEIGGDEIAVTPMIAMELLAGCNDEAAWRHLERYLDNKRMLDMGSGTWMAAARMHFDLRRAALTIRKLNDCCIAQVAIENEVVLVHDERDFDAIAKLFHLKHLWLELRRVR